MPMNLRVDKIQDFVKMNIQPKTDKKGKQVTFTNQLPLHATTNSRNQGASSSQTYNINHVHVNEEAVETTLVISSLRSGKDLPDPYKHIHSLSRCHQAYPILCQISQRYMYSS